MKSLINQKLRHIEIGRLHFDPKNPRLPEEVAGDCEQDVLDFLLGEANLDDLMKSIGSQGYFSGEPLLVTPANNPEDFIVVEGNRRLGALKLLSGTEPPRKMRLVEIIRQESKTFTGSEKIPCIVFSNRNDILGYLGYRHITGIKEWDHLAKARYLHQLYKSLRANPDHENTSESEIHKKLAKNIGSKSNHVAVLLQGLSILEFADEQGILSELGKSPRDLYFSLLTTAIGSRSIRNYLYGISDEDKSTEDMYNEDKLTVPRVTNVFKWLYGYGDRLSVVGDSRNIGKLSKVLTDTKATEYFISNINRPNILETSFNLAGGLLEGFDKLLLDIQDKFENLQNIYPSIQSDITKNHVTSLNSFSTSVRHFSRNVTEDFNEKDDE